MAEVEGLEVRVSRKILLILALVGFLFLIAGLDIGIFHKVFDASFGQDKALIKWAFMLFAVIIGGVIFVNCFIYLIFPPLMLRVTREKIVFGVGMRYNPFEVPAHLLEKAESFTRESNLEVNGKREVVDGGACLYLRNDPAIPSQKTTSMGIKYSGYKLEISSTYADIGGKELVAKVKQLLGKP